MTTLAEVKADLLLDHCAKHEKSGRAQFSTAGIRTLAEAYIASRGEIETTVNILQQERAYTASVEARLTVAEARIKELEAERGRA